MKVANCSAPSKVCAVVLDEMTIKEGVSYNPSRDEVEGYEDFGYLGRTAFIANHAIVFLLRGLHNKWKQPVGYFLSNGTMNGHTMATLLKDCISIVFLIRGLHNKWKQPVGYFLSNGTMNGHTMATLLKDCISIVFLIRGLHDK